MRAGTAQPVQITGLSALAMSGAIKCGDAPPALAPITPNATKTPANVSATFFAPKAEKLMNQLARVNPSQSLQVISCLKLKRTPRSPLRSEKILWLAV